MVDRLEVCDTVGPAASTGNRDVIVSCGQALGDVYGALFADDEPDAIRRGARWFVAWGLVDAALRLTSTRAAIDAGETARVAPSPGTGTQVRIFPDRQTLRMRPLRPLRPGRRWSLVVDGLTPAELGHARATVLPRPGTDGLEVPPGRFADPLARWLEDDPTGLDRDKTIAVARRLEQDARELPGISPVGAVEFRLPAPLSAEQLQRIVARFVPAKQAPRSSTIVELPVVDARASLRAHRDRLATAKCSEDRAVQRPWLVDPSPDLAIVVSGAYPGLGITRPAGDRLEEIPAKEAPATAVPYLLSLPVGFDANTPLVIGVHGHAGNAHKFLADHAAGLAERGLALLTIDLPEHGERAERGAHRLKFLGVLDPTRLRANVRQSTVDVLAAIRSSLDCGFVLPDGATYRPTDVRYLGYSLGSLLGVTVRSLSPRLGPAALVAAAGDLAGWLLVHVPHHVSSTMLTCLGGAEHGRACTIARPCEAPGVCWANPYFAVVAGALELPYSLVLAPAEPLGPARVRTGDGSHAPVLLLTAGQDGTLFSLLQARLAVAYDMRGEPPDRVHGPGSERIHFPTRGHELIEADEVRTAAYDFLARPRRISPTVPSVDNDQAPR